MSDPINPDHYRAHYRQEVADTLTDWVARAPDPVAGALHWNAGKYTGRLWDKGDPVVNIGKAIWYLERLRQHVEAGRVPFDVSADLSDDMHEHLISFEQWLETSDRIEADGGGDRGEAGPAADGQGPS